MVRKAKSWLWEHREPICAWACVVGGLVLMVGGANKLVYGRLLPNW